MTERRTTLPPVNLAEAFNPPNRAEGLGGLRRRAAAPVEPSAPEPAPVAEVPPADVSPPPVRPAVVDPAGAAQVVAAAYVPVELRAALIDERQRSKITDEPQTTASIVLSAVESVLAQPGGLPADPPPARPRGMFRYQPQPVRRVVSVQISFRVTQADRDTLDHLADEHTNGDRSRLVTLALEHRYAGRRDTASS